MADISAFPTITPVEATDGDTFTYTAGAAITAGMVVCFEATGVSRQVIKCVAGAGTWPIGVAITSAASGAKVTVQTSGYAYVANADDTTGIDAGDFLEMNDNAVGGTVNAAAITASGATVTPHYCVGVAVEDIAGGGTGLCLIMPQVVIQANAS
jgi:predicted RecA/RadA family phage recombinase